MGLDRSSAPSNKYGWLLTLATIRAKQRRAAYEAFLSSMAMFIKLTCWVPPLLKAAKFYKSAPVSNDHGHTFVKMST
jgi:hypothetical protein